MRTARWVGIVRTEVYRGDVLGKYPTEVFGKVRYGLNIPPPNTPVWFGTSSIPVPYPSVTSVRSPKVVSRVYTGIIQYSPTEHTHRWNNLFLKNEISAWVQCTGVDYSRIGTTVVCRTPQRIPSTSGTTRAGERDVHATSGFCTGSLLGTPFRCLSAASTLSLVDDVSAPTIVRTKLNTQTSD